TTTITAGTLVFHADDSIRGSTVAGVQTSSLPTATTAGASITTLSGAGSVVLGSETLTLTAGAGTFSGAISGTGALIVNGTGTEKIGRASCREGGEICGGGCVVGSDGRQAGDSSQP